MAKSFKIQEGPIAKRLLGLLKKIGVTQEMATKGAPEVYFAHANDNNFWAAPGTIIVIIALKSEWDLATQAVHFDRWASEVIFVYARGDERVKNLETLRRILGVAD